MNTLLLTLALFVSSCGSEPKAVPQDQDNTTTDYFDEAKAIWQNSVPPSGQSATVEGELLRAVEKLRDEAIRNGNGNWDSGHELLIAYIETTLVADPAFDAEASIKIKTITDRLRNFDDVLLDDEPYDCLSDRVVDFHRAHGSQPHEKNPALKR